MKGMWRLRDVLYEASQECEPGKEHGEDNDAVFALPAGFEDWEIFEPGTTDGLMNEDLGCTNNRKSREPQNSLRNHVNKNSRKFSIHFNKSTSTFVV